MSEDDDGDCSFSSRLWDAPTDSATLTAARNVIRVYCDGGYKPGRWESAAGGKRPWERVIDEISRQLIDDTGAKTKFFRPPAKTDRLFAVLERGTDPVLVKHPVPAPGREHLYRENLPNIRCGTIASGHVVARHAAWRTQVKLTAHHCHNCQRKNF